MFMLVVMSVISFWIFGGFLFCFVVLFYFVLGFLFFCLFCFVLFCFLFFCLLCLELNRPCVMNLLLDCLFASPMKGEEGCGPIH